MPATLQSDNADQCLPRMAGRCTGAQGGTRRPFQAASHKRKPRVAAPNHVKNSRPQRNGRAAGAPFSKEICSHLSVSIVGSSSTISDVLAESLRRVLDADPDCPRGGPSIWRNAFWRASWRPMGMVLDIVGDFQVCVNPGSFHKDDRPGATVALARDTASRKAHMACNGVRNCHVSSSLLSQTLPRLMSQACLTWNRPSTSGNSAWLYGMSLTCLMATWMTTGTSVSQQKPPRSFLQATLFGGEFYFQAERQS